MNKLFIVLLITISSGCVSKQKYEKLEIDIKECINQQIDLYNDLCIEESSGYEEMNGSDAHYEGVKCAVESINYCIKDLLGG